MKKTGSKSIQFETRHLDDGFTMVPNIVLRNHGLSVPARLTYALLNDFARRAERFWPGQNRFAELLKVQERQLRKYVNELEAAGLIKTFRRGLGQSNGYLILDPERASDRSSGTGQKGADCPDQTGPPGPVKTGPQGPVTTEEPTTAEATSSPSGDDVALPTEERSTAPQQEQVDVEREIGDATYLLPFVDPVFERLAKVAAAKPGSITPTRRGVARLLRRMPNKDFLPVADAFEHGYIDGRYRNRPVKDVVATYRNWLFKESNVSTKTPPPGVGSPAADARHRALTVDTRERLEAADR